MTPKKQLMIIFPTTPARSPLEIFVMRHLAKVAESMHNSKKRVYSTDDSDSEYDDEMMFCINDRDDYDFNSSEGLYGDYDDWEDYYDSVYI